MVEDPLREKMLAAIPHLRAFAISFTNNPDHADDLVQDTILRAWAKIDQFERGTNLKGWLFTILRNHFHSEYRKRKRKVEDRDGSYAARLRTHPDQQGHLDCEDFRTALATLPWTSERRWSWLGLRGCPRRRVLRCAMWRSAPSKAARTGLDPRSQHSWTSPVRLNLDRTN
jgi:RNA polymerase sigma-70 factor (ECF subfamily)